MAYQALLFCPDEKTARTVTQVLSELDFAVSPSTEPFAAVKKLMAERFDAVVVDCDNEQNATLLFKSARNAPNNSSALAVAVVEGQAGVAKAFRIGANLVLTKPINVEQAKGTLRVARGLLRKNESSKATAVPGTPINRAGATGESPKVPPSSPTLSAARPGSSAPTAAASAPAPKLSAPASAEEHVRDATSNDEIPSVLPESEIVAPSIPSSEAPDAVSIIESTAKANPEAVSELQPARTPANLSVGIQGAASAPAPALEPKAGDPASSGSADGKITQEKVESKAKIIEDETVPEKSDEVSVAAPTFGMAESETQPSSGGKKALLAVAAVALIAVAGYWAWSQFGGGHTAPISSVQPASRPIPTAPAPQAISIPPTTLPPANSATPAPSPTSPANAEADVQSSTVTETPHASSSAPAKESVQPRATTSAGANSKAVPAKPSDETAESVRPIIVKGGTVTRSAKPQTDAPAPEIAGIAATQNSAGLPNLVNTSNEPAPVLEAMSVSQGVSQGLVIKKVSPTYPPNALRLRIEGAVELLATVSKKGDISAVKVLRGDPNLTRAAVDAVKQWKYQPYLLDGAPVEIQTQVTVNFKLPH